jgi:Bacterial SH3 domain
MSLGCVLAQAAGARPALAADEEPEAFARVIVDSADLRTGPGISYRVLYTAHRGETFALDGRPGAGFWLRVLLPDGRAAYALGDEVQPFAVTPGEEGAPSRPGLFAPPPLQGSRGGFSMIGGILVTPVADGSIQRYGYVEVRPSLVVHRTVTLDGFFGDALTSDGSELIYGGGVTIHLTPSWPLSPFLGIAAGGFSVFPNSDSFVLKRQDLYLARATAGVLFALKNRILVRLEANNLSLFAPDSYKNAQIYAGGLGVYF